MEGVNLYKVIVRMADGELRCQMLWISHYHECYANIKGN